MKEVIFFDEAFEHLGEWIERNPKTAKKIWKLIKEIRRTPYEGTGKPEPLRFKYSGYWSRRITDEHRLIYSVRNNVVYIVSCKGHYS
ncbi:MAG: Txe/YoeB family addiction module toxin [Bacteroidetes bacterium]|nr:Txe/YoeB family addiction module toxin [Bacteroidota bacterium]